MDVDSLGTSSVEAVDAQPGEARWINGDPADHEPGTPHVRSAAAASRATPTPPPPPFSAPTEPGGSVPDAAAAAAATTSDTPTGKRSPAGDMFAALQALEAPRVSAAQKQRQPSSSSSPPPPPPPPPPANAYLCTKPLDAFASEMLSALGKTASLDGVRAHARGVRDMRAATTATATATPPPPPPRPAPPLARNTYRAFRPVYKRPREEEQPAATTTLRVGGSGGGDSGGARGRKRTAAETGVAELFVSDLSMVDGCPSAESTDAKQRRKRVCLQEEGSVGVGAASVSAAAAAASKSFDEDAVRRLFLQYRAGAYPSCADASASVAMGEEEGAESDALCIAGKGLRALVDEMCGPDLSAGQGGPVFFFIARPRYLNALSWEEFVGAFRLVGCCDVEEARNRCGHLHYGLVRDAVLHQQYTCFCFHFFRTARGGMGKALDRATAQRLLLLVVGQVSPFTLTFAQFLAAEEVAHVTFDQWRNFIPFSSEISESLENYNAADAWPTLFDRYAEWLTANRSAARAADCARSSALARHAATTTTTTTACDVTTHAHHGKRVRRSASPSI